MIKSKEELAHVIDHTNLNPIATFEDIVHLCSEAECYNFFSVCVPPYHVKLAKKLLQNTSVKVISVLGFPLGYQSFYSKIDEAERLVRLGVDEIDMVMNISAFKSAHYDYVRREIENIVGIARNRKNAIVKVIIEACYLTHDELHIACDIVAAGKAAYIKTSTGFGLRGVTSRDVHHLNESIKERGYHLKIKAAGGIKSLNNAMRMLDDGADRLGTSGSVEIMEELKRRMQGADK